MTIENKTSKARPWKPFITAEVGGRKYVAIDRSELLERVRRREGLGSEVDAAGDVLLDGARRTFVLVFGPFDAASPQITMRMHGLASPIVTYEVRRYGEQVVIPDPAYETRNAKILNDVLRVAKEKGAQEQPILEPHQFIERRAYEVKWTRREETRDRPMYLPEARWMVTGDPVAVSLPVYLRVVARDGTTAHHVSISLSDGEGDGPSWRFHYAWPQSFRGGQEISSLSVFGATPPSAWNLTLGRGRIDGLPVGQTYLLRATHEGVEKTISFKVPSIGERRVEVRFDR